MVHTETCGRAGREAETLKEASRDGRRPIAFELGPLQSPVASQASKRRASPIAP